MCFIEPELSFCRVNGELREICALWDGVRPPYKLVNSQALPRCHVFKSGERPPR